MADEDGGHGERVGAVAEVARRAVVDGGDLDGGETVPRPRGEQQELGLVLVAAAARTHPVGHAAAHGAEARLRVRDPEADGAGHERAREPVAHLPARGHAAVTRAGAHHQVGAAGGQRLEQERACKSNCWCNRP